MSMLLHARDVVAAPFTRSRAPKVSTKPESPGRPEKDTTPFSLGQGTTSIGQANEQSINAERAANPRTDPTPPHEEGTHVGNAMSGTASGIRSPETETGNDNRTYVLGVSTRGGGDGRIVVDERGRVVAAEAWNATAGEQDNTAATGEKDNQEGKGLSRLWSRGSRTGADGKRRGSVDEAGGKSPTSTRRMTSPTRSRFNEEPSAESESNTTPASPSSGRVKVPLKDQIKGELKIISGKISRNEAQVEQGIALKTGHTSPTHPAP
ncbi:hypothetical protein BDV93DRAFT_555636 [Ceratobasidium sp. AG-I]|nr:hypothetical protein BDV93DRAFT_555636 [Ceratobasidium sp. AG-I]